MKLFKNIVIASAISCLCGNLYAGTASAKLSALAESLISGYGAKAGTAKVALAAFPFSSEEKLRKQRVGFAVSELMSHRFVADQNFTVVERGEIARLLNEQKLQSSGIADSDTAVRLGNMLGAGVLLLGNLNKVDGLYQVNARIVNVETGEVLASGYTELPVEAFEDDAGVYLNLVPHEQAIGIYGVFNYRHNDNDAPVFTESGPNNLYTFEPKSFTSLLAGGGLLYRPGRNLQINAEITTSKLSKESYLVHTSSYTGPGPITSWRDTRPLEMTTVSLMASYVNRFSARWHYLTGAGVQTILSAVAQKKANPPPIPFVKLGIEYKPQSRIGFGLNMKYELRRAVFRSEYSNNVMLKINPLSFETVLAMYF